MDKIKYLFFFGLAGFFGTADALPIFSHTTNGPGFYTISADGTNEPTDLAQPDSNTECSGTLYLPSAGGGPDRYRDNPLAPTQAVTVNPLIRKKGRHHSPFISWLKSGAC